MQTVGFDIDVAKRARNKEAVKKAAEKNARLLFSISDLLKAIIVIRVTQRLESLSLGALFFSQKYRIKAIAPDCVLHITDANRNRITS